MSEIVKVLNQVAPGADVRLYSESFEKLWELDKLASVPQDKTYVIVWDDIPHKEKYDVVSTSKYLTPIDWAVAFSLAVHDKAAAAKKDDGKPINPNIRILILDLNSQSVSNADSVRFFNQFPQTMPWVRLYRPLDADKLIKNLRDNPDDKAEDKVPFMKGTIEKSDMALIRNVWAAFLTKPSTPGDHHAIANLVGPLLLMGEEEKPDQHTKALRSLMKALGLIPNKANEKGGKKTVTGQEEDPLLRRSNPWIKWDSEPWKDRLSRLTTPEGRLNLILIDDQHTQGWGKVLCQAVGAEYNQDEVPIGKNEARRLTVKAFDSANSLVKRLEELDANNLDQRFRFRIDESDKDEKISEILFLDLRLFSGKSLDDEIKFFKNLIIIARKFEDRNDLPWPCFIKGDIDSVEHWCDDNDGKKREREDEEYIEALTFLPRILSLTDLSMPIVLFSSTGRRDIAEKLKQHGNIITDFDKPKFTVDMPENIAGQTKRKFETALRKALHILAARQKCKKIESKFPLPSIDTNKHGIHLELFIDENYRWTRDDKHDTIYVGGLFAVFTDDDNKKALLKADRFDDDIVRSGVRYFNSLGVGIGPQQIKEKKHKSATELKNEMTRSANRPNSLCFIRLSNSLPNQKEAFDMFNQHSADNLYRLTLIALIELFLCETLPALFGLEVATRTSVSIFVQTRVKDFDDNPVGREELIKAKYHLGYDSFSGKDHDTKKSKHFIYSISRNSVFPIVSDILEFHKIKRNIDRIAGVKLPYKTKGQLPEYFICRDCKEIKKIDTKNDIKITEDKSLKCNCGRNNFFPDYRALHYIADEVLGHAAAVKSGTGYWESIKLVFGGFDDSLNEDLNATINASRYFDSGNIVSAIVTVNTDNAHLTNNYKVKPLLLSRIASKLKDLKGEDFCKIASLIGEKRYV